jgi:hypothetical protein
LREPLRLAEHFL